ncbi:hypothetical protein [Thermosulfurimonas dismutans]|uniref:Uncharacterized protein n=1 Tax=Thermosulfurimonas dismutans TaxID=999894 RepID=A0A179D3Z6_9BACT|nr:hypothetical protein [Thermosulfurimonas dismutans]OAQ20348.1 hypothetical protein TDIS_1543 [Thermosulfurimonas dismutans]
MLTTVEQLKKDAQISWRAPKLLKLSINWWASRSARSENEEGVVLLKEALLERAKRDNLVFMFWKGEVFVQGTDIVNAFTKRILRITLEEAPPKDSVEKTRFELVLAHLENGGFIHFKLPFERLEVFGTFHNQKVDLYSAVRELPWEKRAPALLYLSLDLLGIEAYKLPPNLYEFTSPYLLDMNSSTWGLPLEGPPPYYDPRAVKAVEFSGFPKSMEEVFQTGKPEELILDLIRKGKFQVVPSRPLTPEEEASVDNELPF